ncbi:MAG TPA: hypothetical protein PK752_08015 [Accumulibacter sp.]|uniref:hypothetical protein n=1 Tax=Accumulibacter sp. TaxID=2053492 RepID=UPI002BB3A014|nr:hypothetical protein [Accumulibacter sp.]HRD88194.1 hypothetical protein [Accumulibacter sp.]
MQAFLTIEAMVGLTALLSHVNERFLRLQQSIGLMVMARDFTIVRPTATIAIVLVERTIRGFSKADQLKRLLNR